MGRCGSTSSSASPAGSTPRRRRSTRCCARCLPRRSGPSPASAVTTSGCSALALLKGAPGIRTGLEDVAYIAKGELAPSNAALVEMAVGMARSLGREVATQDQTKGLLGLG